MTECGLDPGIDLVLYARAARQFDTITAIDSYCGGIPEPKARAEPLCYKVSWNFDMVLMSQNRDSVLVEDGERVEVPAGQQHDNPFHPRDRGRWARHARSLPQWRRAALCRDARRRRRAAAHRPLLAALAGMVGVLGAAEAARLPLRGAGAGPEPRVSPREFLGRLLGPQLQYGADEKDLCVMRKSFPASKAAAARR